MGTYEVSRFDLSDVNCHARFESDKAVWSKVGVHMTVKTQRQAVADLVEAAIPQEEFARQRWTLEWGELVLARLVHVWNQLQTHEALASEDKLAVQLRVLDEATSRLWCLHKPPVHTRRLLKQHRQNLPHHMTPTKKKGTRPTAPPAPV
jgi:hypothetical protein